MMLALVMALAAQTPRDSFPHAAHARLFASCTTCHAGVTTGRAADAMPQPAQCRPCHDGTRERVVAWEGPRLRPHNLRFSHREHEREVRGRNDSAVACVSCHAQSGARVFMAAGRAEPERCLSCHAHEASGGHLAAAQCTSCHVPLREAAALGAEQVAAFPEPPSHDDDYVFRHANEARSASCQVCHTSESCASCHVNAARLAEITTLGRLPVHAGLARARRVYPVPPGHRSVGFARGHGTEAGTAGARCANCHARQSCTGCHGSDERAGAIAALPVADAAGAPGVNLSHRRPPDHGAGFLERHRAVSGATDQACSSCHTQRFCVACHSAAAGDRYHAANFALRHSSAAYRTDTECSSCHQVTAFCSACHRENGIAAGAGAPRGSFHSGAGNWLLGHGGVARRSLATCASCHTQTFCTACHSTTRGLRVNPHGARPPADDRNRPSCRACHR